MKIIFIAGPFTGDGSAGAQKENIRKAEEFAAALAEHSIGYYSPHLHTNALHAKYPEKVPDNFCRELNALYYNNATDALLAMPGWESSRGASAEVSRAKELGMPIFYPKSPADLEEIIAWSKS